MCVDEDIESGSHLAAGGPPPPPKVYNRSRTVWVPPGEWTDAFSGQTVAGPTTLKLTNVSLDTMPLYHRHGGIVVTVCKSISWDFTENLLER